MRTIAILAAGGTTALALAVPASAATVSPAGVRFPQVAVGAAGATAVAWERASTGGFAVEARVGGAPSRLGATRRLSPRGHSPLVAVGADGTVAVMWVELGAHRTSSIRVAVARPGHRLGRGQLVDRRRANMRPVGVAVAPGGRVVALWQRSATSLAFALARSGHAFTAARGLAGAAPRASLTLDPRDGAVVVVHATTTGQTVVRTLARSASSFTAATTLLTGSGPAPGQSQPSDAVAVSGPGGAAVAYTLIGDARTLNLARRAADGSWPTRERIATAAYGEGVFAQQLRAALPADGAAVAAWSIQTESGGAGAILSSRTVTSVTGASGAFGAPQPLTPPAARFGPPAVVAAEGQAFVATAAPHGPVLLATRAPGASQFAPPTTLTANSDGDVLLAAAGRHVLAVYQQRDRLRLKIVR